MKRDALYNGLRVARVWESPWARRGRDKKREPVGPALPLLPVSTTSAWLSWPIEISAQQVVSWQAAAATGSISPAKKTAPCERNANWLMKGSFFKGPLSLSGATMSRGQFLCRSMQQMMQNNLCCTANQAEITVVRCPIVTLSQRLFARKMYRCSNIPASVEN